MFSLEQAQNRLLESIPHLGCEEISPAHAWGRVLAADVIAPLSLPPFDNSAMDGFAVRSQDVIHASPSTPVTLRELGVIAAGDTPSLQVHPGTCVRLFTGAPLPLGADAVVMQEDTCQGNNAIHVLDPVKPWENVRFQGEDIRAGQTCLSSGRRLDSTALGLIAGFGLEKVTVHRRPRITLLATGEELREAGHPLLPGQIYESNRLMIASILEAVGAVCHIAPVVPDNLAATQNALLDAFATSDAVVTSGGVSVGERDHVKAAFAQISGELDLWKVAIKPGKPFAFGRFQNKLLFGLPGNPVSAFVTCMILVRPAILQYQRARQVHLPQFDAVAGERFENRGDRRHFVRVRFDDHRKVVSSGTQASHFMSSLATAEGLIDLAPQSTVEQGESLRVSVF